MARKKQFKIPLYVKVILIGLFFVGVSIVIVNRTRHVFSHMDYFRIQSVSIDPSLQFINKRDLNNIIGKNIFTIDLKGVQRRLDYKYPQASQLKISRIFPDQISVIAKQRMPYAQIQIQNQVATLDEENVVLSLGKKKDKDLPDIVGAKLNNPQLVLGLPLKGSDILIAMKIIKFFKAESSLASHSIRKINIENLSKIYFTLSNQLEIIIDQDKIAHKIRVLNVVLSRGELDLEKVKYIDLRFKEPIIGKK